MVMRSMISQEVPVDGCVIVLGGTGRLGSILRVFWPDPDDLVVHSRSEGSADIVFDLRDPSVEVIKALGKVRAIICLSGVTPATENADFSLNATLAVAAVELGKRVKATRVFCVSSAAVYGDAEGPQTEDAECAPVSAYGTAKLEMERDALQVAGALDQYVTMLRIGNVAGADAILNGWKEGMTLDQFPDGTTPVRSYIGPRKLAEALFHLTHILDLPKILNIAAPDPVSMGQLLDAADLPWAARQSSETAIKSVHLSTKRLENHVSFTSQDSMAAGLVAEWHALRNMKKDLT